MTTPIRLFSFDGGSGGPTYLRVLKQLEDACPGTTQATDLFVGSSFGTVTALYLAQALTPGADAGDVIDGCIEATNDFITSLLPQEGDYLRLLKGWQSLTGDGRERAVFEELFGDTTLGDLPNKVLVISGRGKTPWQPTVMCNFGPNATNDMTLVDAALRSCAFPVWMPMQDGHTDGFLFTNSPAAVAVAAVVAGWDGTRDTSRLDQIRLLSVGQDSGTSLLAQLGNPETLGKFTHQVMDLLGKTPDMAFDDAPGVIGSVLDDLDDDAVADLITDASRHWDDPSLTTREHLHERITLLLDSVPPQHRDALIPELLANRDKVDRAIDLATQLNGAHHSFQAKAAELADIAMHGQGHGRIPHSHTDEVSTNDDTPTNSWGWIQWLAWLTNPVWLLQAMMTNQGLGTQALAADLLDEGNTWRVAPMGLMSSNDVFILLFLRLQGVVEFGSEVCADLWSFWPTNLLLEFDPELFATHRWINKTWLADTESKS